MLTRFTPEDSSFVHIAFSENQTTLSNSFAPWTVYEDRSQILWVGTNGSGIFKIDLKPQKFRHYQHDRNDPQSLADNDIRFLFEDKDGFLWIATRNAGLSRFDPKSESFRDFSHNPNDPNTLSANDVRSIIQDSNGNLWIGTTAGLNIRKPGIEYFSRILFKTTQLDGPKTQPWVRSMLEDNAGIIWIGTRAHGLLKYDVKTDTISQFIVNEKAQIETRINDVRFIYEDCSGRLWVDMWHQENLLNGKHKSSFRSHFRMNKVNNCALVVIILKIEMKIYGALQMG